MAPPATKNHQQQQSSSSKPLKTTTIPATQPSPQNPITLSQQDVFLSRTIHLTRREVIKRRAHNLKQLTRCYRDHYWALMEELKTQFRNYYWKFGVSPFKETPKQQVELQPHDRGDIVKIEGVISEINGGLDLGLIISGHRQCSYNACKIKAMALTTYCHLHILSDPKQRLYKPCDYAIRSYPTGPIMCGKPILKSTVPSLCTVHFQKAQKHVAQSLKRAGLNNSTSNRFAPKLHVILVEYVRFIQAKRKLLIDDESKIIVTETNG